MQNYIEEIIVIIFILIGAGFIIYINMFGNDNTPCYYDPYDNEKIDKTWLDKNDYINFGYLKIEDEEVCDRIDKIELIKKNKEDIKFIKKTNLEEKKLIDKINKEYEELIIE